MRERQPMQNSNRFGLVLTVTALWAAAGLSGWAGPSAAAQDQPAAALAPAVSSNSLLADQLVLLTRKTLAGQGQSTPDQLTCARTLLRMALQLDEQNPELWRLWRELAQRAGQRADELEGLRHYCTLRPDDDAAQLDLILSSMQTEQTLDQRLAAVERLLDSPLVANQFSAPLRSRLASYVARGAQETGAQKQFINRLKLALNLDPTNADAWHMLYEMVLQHNGSPAEQGVALAGIIKADPFDAGIRRQLAQLLLAQGAYAQAATQFSVTQNLVGDTLDNDFYHDWAFSLIAQHRLDDALDVLNTVFRRLNPAAATPAKPGPSDASKPPGTSPATTTAPATAPLTTIDLELLRLTIYYASNQAQSAQTSLQRITDDLAQRVQTGDKQSQADQLWLACLFNNQAPDSKVMESLRREMGEKNLALLRLTAWGLLAQNNPVPARQALATLPDHDPFRLLGEARLQGGAKDAAGQALLQQVVAAEPHSLAALLAAQQLLAANLGVAPTPQGAALAKIVDDLPRRLREVSFADGNWIQLTATVAPQVQNYFDPLVLHIGVRNLTDFPLAITPTGPVSPRLFIYLQPARAGQALGNLPAVVADVGRRLVLQPHQLLQQDIRLDHTDLGWLLAISPTERTTINGVAILDPRAENNGRVMLGPLGVTADITPVEHLGQPLTDQNIPSFLAALTTPDTVAQMKALAWLEQNMAALSVAGPQHSEHPAFKQITDAVTKLFPQYDPVMQAWSLRFLAPDAHDNRTFPRLHELAQNSTDPLVRIVYLTAVVEDPAALAVDAAIRSDNPKIAQFAKAWRVCLTKYKAASDAAKVPTDNTPKSENQKPVDNTLSY